MQHKLFVTSRELWDLYVEKIKHINSMYWVWTRPNPGDRIFVADKAEEIVYRDQQEMEAFKELQEGLKTSI